MSKLWKSIVAVVIALILSIATLLFGAYFYSSIDEKNFEELNASHEELKGQYDDLDSANKELQDKYDDLVGKLESEGLYDAETGFIVVEPKSITEGEVTLNGIKVVLKGEGDVITVGNATVTIDGGLYDGGQTPFGGVGNTVVWAKDANAKVVINGGAFNANGLATDEEGNLDVGHIDMIYCSAGTIEVNGGHFEGADGTVWLLNCKDAAYKDGTAKIVVKGGTFVNWNPADNVSEGEHTNFVAEGYEVVTETKENGDVWYTVVETTVPADGEVTE